MNTTIISSRERLKLAFSSQKLDRPPIWFMRQAGRYLPEYRAIKEKYTFLQMIANPELATEVTVQPLTRFPGLDAAILFSDILVVSQALGLPFFFKDTGGIHFPYTISRGEQIDMLGCPSDVHEQLNHVPSTLKLIRGAIGLDKGLLGFVGSPFTLASYMVEGGASKDYSKLKSLAFEHPKDFQRLLQKLTLTTIEYIKMQISAGVDAIQIFDSNAFICPGNLYWDLSLQYIKQIIDALPASRPPFILFAKHMSHLAPQLLKTGVDCLSLDWSVDLRGFLSTFPFVRCIQGNLDPSLLSTNTKVVTDATINILDTMKERPGHIFNLGHGILPNAKIECVEAMINTVVNYNG